MEREEKERKTLEKQQKEEERLRRENERKLKMQQEIELRKEEKLREEENRKVRISNADGNIDFNFLNYWYNLLSHFLKNVMVLNIQCA